MKFGKVDTIAGIDFDLPADHPDTAKVLGKNQKSKAIEVYVGGTNWNRQKLKNFYPRGTKDELAYYATQLNAIEFNAAFYRIFPKEQYEKWASKVPSNFKFFPKIYQGISHWKRLKNAAHYVDENINAILRLEDNLEMPFIQMHQNFGPTDENLKTLKHFIEEVWPYGMPLAFELRHQNWFDSPEIIEEVYQLFERHQITNIITDTAGRRDMLHMRLTTSAAFIRYVGSNDPLMDYKRIEDWVDRITAWSRLDIHKVYFFVHQHREEETIPIARHFIEKLNKAIGTNIKTPKLNHEI